MSLAWFEVFGVLMRWVHVASAALLVGGVAYARFAVAPVLDALPAEDRPEAWRQLGWRFRSLLYPAMAGLILSGGYAVGAHRGHSAYYLVWLGIKLLLAAHIFAAAILWVRTGTNPADEAKRNRRATGIVISGLAVLLVAAYLHTIY
jgi:uncharacterized membrane protein